ncbi:hypothetical protein LWI28_018177 [Acer negundo]|uniref:Uncharacterized protein n=1 Tax=Acer negundo TaxID=4023 RepID=A0AAD5JV35_ACENE|nr:hypothetical protein LWI28_018177 [Acer negundo]
MILNLFICPTTSCQSIPPKSTISSQIIPFTAHSSCPKLHLPVGENGLMIHGRKFQALGGLSCSQIGHFRHGKLLFIWVQHHFLSRQSSPSQSTALQTGDPGNFRLPERSSRIRGRKQSFNGDKNPTSISKNR